MFTFILTLADIQRCQWHAILLVVTSLALMAVYSFSMMLTILAHTSTSVLAIGIKGQVTVGYTLVKLAWSGVPMTITCWEWNNKINKLVVQMCYRFNCFMLFLQRMKSHHLCTHSKHFFHSTRHLHFCTIFCYLCKIFIDFTYNWCIHLTEGKVSWRQGLANLALVPVLLRSSCITMSQCTGPGTRLVKPRVQLSSPSVTWIHQF